MGLLRRLRDIERTLAALVEAVNAAGDEQARRQAGILTALASHDSRTADLAEMIQQVMAARAQHDAVVAADAKAARSASEYAVAGIQSLVAIRSQEAREAAVRDAPPPPAGSAGNLPAPATVMTPARKPPGGTGS
jgi:hypothetical protein